MPYYSNETFENWLFKVDRMLVEKVRKTSLDFPNKPFSDWYADGVSAPRAVSLILGQPVWTMANFSNSS